MLTDTSVRASQLKAALALRAVPPAGSAARPVAPQARIDQPQIDLFIYRLGSGEERGRDCQTKLHSLGYYIRSTNPIEQGPKYDKIIYFWTEDEPLVRTLQRQLSTCGLRVPDGNLILVDPRSDYDTGKVAPRAAFEVWTSVGPSGSG